MRPTSKTPSHLTVCLATIAVRYGIPKAIHSISCGLYHETRAQATPVLCTTFGYKSRYKWSECLIQLIQAFPAESARLTKQ